MVCDDVRLDSSSPAGIPDVVVDEVNRSVAICGSRVWKRINDLPGLFVGIISHESIHLTLLRIDGSSSEYLDNVASLSTISRSLRDIPLVGKYSHGMIGLDL